MTPSEARWLNVRNTTCSRSKYKKKLKNTSRVRAVRAQRPSLLNRVDCLLIAYYYNNLHVLLLFLTGDLVLMAPKKKSSKKSSGAIGDGTRVDDLATIDNTPPLVIPPDIPHYVTLDLRLLNWSYLNFKIRVKTTTRLFAVKQQIHKHHGPITDLKLCKGNFAEANEMHQDLDTLADYGIEGAPEHEAEVVCVIHYDFKPQQHDNPLLLASEAK